MLAWFPALSILPIGIVQKWGILVSSSLELLTCELFAGLNLRGFVLAPRDLRPLTAEPGQILINQHDQNDEVYFMLEGMTYAVHFDATGRETIFTRHKTHDYFGEMAALDGKGRALSVYAKTRTRLLAMRGTAFRQMLEDHPQIKHKLLLDMVERIREMARDRADLVLRRVDDRVRSYIVRQALEAEAFVPKGFLHDFPTHAEIASTIGANREAVSRAMSRLKSLNIIEPGRNNLCIIDPEQLLVE